MTVGSFSCAVVVEDLGSARLRWCDGNCRYGNPIPEDVLYNISVIGDLGQKESIVAFGQVGSE